MAENTTPLVKKNGVAVGRGWHLNFIEGANITITETANDQGTEITIAGQAGGAGGNFAVDTGGNVA